MRHLDEAAARDLAVALERNLPWTVTSVEAKPGVERPAPPFTTSTLTQEASRKLGYSTGRTMQIAQRLFQGVEIGNGEIEGLITYHRTDSTTLSDKALTESARVIRDMFGAEYHDGPRRYQTKVKNAQEAHEAIRPSDFRQTPQKLASLLEPDELRLYDLIWKRDDGVADEGRARPEDDRRDHGRQRRLHRVGQGHRVRRLPPRLRRGQRRPGGRARGSGDDPAGLHRRRPGGEGRPSRGWRLLGLDAKKHETLPPARYTEAALIKELEAAGIGRPSTYASIIQTIQNRGYVFRQGKALVP